MIDPCSIFSKQTKHYHCHWSLFDHWSLIWCISPNKTNNLAPNQAGGSPFGRRCGPVGAALAGAVGRGRGGLRLLLLLLVPSLRSQHLFKMFTRLAKNIKKPNYLTNKDLYHIWVRVNFVAVFFSDFQTAELPGEMLCIDLVPPGWIHVSISQHL